MERREGGLGLFVLNGTGRSVSADLLFPVDVTVSDLASAIHSKQKAFESPLATLEQALAEKRVPGAISLNDDRAQSQRFHLEVPPSGVLPIAVDGLDQSVREADERRAAAHSVVTGELPGYAAEGDLWN